MSYTILQFSYEAKNLLPRELCLEADRGLQTNKTREILTKLEVPYRGTEALHQGAYKHEDLDGKPIP